MVTGKTGVWGECMCKAGAGRFRKCCRAAIGGYHRPKTSCFVMVVFVSVLMLISVNAYSALSISPAFVEVTLDKGVPSGQFLVTNVGDSEERYRIKAKSFLFLEDGGVRLAESDEQSLATWIKFNPKEFTLAPNTRQTIRFAVIPRGKLRPGEYWAVMELESLASSFASGKDAGGREFNLEIVPSILVPICGKVGDVKYQGTLKQLRAFPVENGSVIEVYLTNTGDGRLRVSGEYEIFDSNGKKLEQGSLGKGYVLVGSTRKFATKTNLQLTQGKYSIKVNYSSEQLKSPIRNEIEITWPPPT